MKSKPQLVSFEKWVFLSQKGRVIKVIMKLQKILDNERSEFPENYKFNWIAYDEESPQEKVLFDNHHGKEPHYHIDQDKKGTAFAWISLSLAKLLFWEKINNKFGLLEEI